MSFGSIEDQPLIVSALKRALETNRLPHGLLFLGPRGAGQRRAAVELAKALFCGNKKSSEACDACVQCRQADSLVHPDLVVLEPAPGSSVIKVEEIRAVIARAYLKPLQASAKVFIIDPADSMNEVSQNAILKTLEEPPGKTFFVLIAAGAEGLLPTVRSRVQTLHFLPVRRKASDGESEKLDSQVFKFILHEIDGLGGVEGGGSLSVPDLSKRERADVAELLNFLTERFRELLLLRIGADEAAGVPRSQELERYADAFEEDELAERIELLSEMREKILSNLNTKLVMSVLWDTLIQAKRGRYAGK